MIQVQGTGKEARGKETSLQPNTKIQVQVKRQRYNSTTKHKDTTGKEARGKNAMLQPNTFTILQPITVIHTVW